MKVAIYGIAKNEEKHVDAFLENVRDADGVYVADTGSTDKTLRQLWRSSYLLSPYTNRGYIPIIVSPFRFDVARNTALALVPDDIDVCISLDMDERLSEGWRENLERGWNQVPGTTKMAVQYETPGFQTFWHNSRIHARNGYYWQDPCHEHIWPWMIEEKEVASKSIKITHYPDRTKKRSYLPLLAAGLNEEPGKIRRMFYYAREMMANKEYEIALGWFKKYIQLHEAAGVEEWWESEQVRAMITLCEGALNEQRERREADRLP